MLRPTLDDEPPSPGTSMPVSSWMLYSTLRLFAIHRFRTAIHYAFRQRGVTVLRVLLPPSRRVRPLHRYRIGRKTCEYKRSAIPSKERTPRPLTTHRCDSRRQRPSQQTHALTSVRAVVILMLSQGFIHLRIDTFIISYYMYGLINDHTIELMCKQGLGFVRCLGFRSLLNSRQMSHPDPIPSHASPPTSPSSNRINHFIIHGSPTSHAFHSCVSLPVVL
jgi:hypothetical protein